ncbi:hypothetical protein ACE193_10465 [Bernardetia sp. OM2101]|uniref:hypothetical protein n=1 Tax=Bernardetia sp. OM2101 TaxID=3344876 RepID=UPI0035CFC699
MQRTLTEEEEKNIISAYSTPFSPRVWAARNGHRILCGDMRRYIFKDKIFEKWIHEVYKILHTEDLSEVRKEILTQPEIDIIEEEDSF